MSGGDVSPETFLKVGMTEHRVEVLTVDQSTEYMVVYRPGFDIGVEVAVRDGSVTRYRCLIDAPGRGISQVRMFATQTHPRRWVDVGESWAAVDVFLATAVRMAIKTINARLDGEGQA